MNVEDANVDREEETRVTMVMRDNINFLGEDVCNANE